MIIQSSRCTWRKFGYPYQRDEYLMSIKSGEPQRDQGPSFIPFRVDVRSDGDYLLGPSGEVSGPFKGEAEVEEFFDMLDSQQKRPRRPQSE